MPNTVTIRVHYPLVDGEMVLFTDRDWSRAVTPESRTDNPTRFDFQITTNRPFFYFKPCIVDSNGTHWSQGANYLVLTNAGPTRDIHPHFFPPAGGIISDAIEVESRSTGTTHTVRIYHPPGYYENTYREYPVVYMQDGHNLFHPEEAAFGTEWRMDETLDLLDSMNLIDKVIVVGIYPKQRMEQYTRPGYAEYARFVAEDLKPQIDRSLRTLSDAANTAVIGSSLGGVASLYLAWERPETFGMAACLSSTFGWRDDLMERIGREEKRDIRLYIDSGWPRDNYEVSRAMANLLISRGYRFGEEILYVGFPGALHNEANWGARVHLPFQFFFGKLPR